MLKEIVKIKGGFVKAVKLIDDFSNEQLNKRKLESYCPNPSSRDAIYSISQGLHPASSGRVHLLSGTYGSGKSHLALVIANYLTKNSDSKDLEMLFSRIKEKEPGRASEIFNMRNTDNPYLVVLLEGYDPDGAEHFLLEALQSALHDPKIGKLPEDTLKTSFLSALKKIEEWEEKKLNFYEQLNELLKEREEDIDELKLKLVPGFDREAYLLFKELHLEITTSTFVPIFSEKTSMIYPEISELLAKEHGYKGIAIIWDQFNDHLDASSHLGKEVSFLRDFVEKVERPENQLFLVFISHNLPHTYIRGKIDKEALDNWMTLEGRFRQHVLTAIEEAEELLDSAIVQVWETEQGSSVKDEIEKSANPLIDAIIELDLYPNKDRYWIMETLCKGAFPLHPLATYCLPRISDVVGQAERTMFTFFEEAIKEGGLARFTNESDAHTSDGKLNLYTADKLFDFFREAIENTPDTMHIARNYSEAMSKVKAPEEALTQRMLKSVAVSQTMRHPVPSTSFNLALLLDVEESKIGHLLDSLVDNEVLWCKANGAYEFRTGLAVFNLDDDFKQSREEVSWDNPTAALSDEYNPEYILAKKYCGEYRVYRWLSTYYIDADGLNNIKEYEKLIENEYRDGIALYVVAENMADIKKARKQAINIRHPQIVVTIPKSPLDIYEGLRNVKALKSLGRKTPYNIEGTEAHHIWKDKYDTEVGKLDSEVASWKKVSNLDWFREGATIDATDKSAEDIADLVMFNVFNKTPIVEHRKMANYYETDDRANRVTLNTLILDTKSEEIAYPAKGREPPAKTILEQTFRSQGMLRDRLEGNQIYYKIVESPTGNMKKVWEVMSDCLTKSGGHTQFAKLIDDLRSPPYGLCPRAIELFISAFLRFHRDRISIKTGRTKTSPWEKRDFIGETIYEIVNETDPEKVLVEYREQLPLEITYLKKVNSIISPDEPWDSKLNAVDGVGKLFVAWIQNLLQVTKCNIGHEKCRIFLDEIGDVDRDQDMMELMLEKLPSALGIVKGLEYWDKEDLDNFYDTFKVVADELNNYPSEVVAKGIDLFKSIFNVTGNTERDVMRKIEVWFSKLGPAAKEHKYSGYASILMQHRRIRSTDSFEDKFLVKLPRGLGLEEYTKWQKVEGVLTNYRNILSQSKAEIETVHMEATGKPVDEAEELPPKAESLKGSLKQLINEAGIGRDEIILALESLLEEYRG